MAHKEMNNMNKPLTIDDIAEMAPAEAQEWVWLHNEEMQQLPDDVADALFERSNPS